MGFLTWLKASMPPGITEMALHQLVSAEKHLFLFFFWLKDDSVCYGRSLAKAILKTLVKNHPPPPPIICHLPQRCFACFSLVGNHP